VSLVDPTDGLPDMVFTANAGVVKDRTFVPSRFRHAERQGEEACFEAWFEREGYDIRCIDNDHEGAGDFLQYETRDGDLILFAAHGFRSEESAHASVGHLLGQSVVSLELRSPAFYHLDTCFCPLPGSGLLWFPAAFTPASVAAIERWVPGDCRFAVDEADASRFACNAIAVPGHIVMNDCGDACRLWLEERGFTVHLTGLGEFMKAGGSAKCLSLQLT
jgi:N-dimethylarginine dimethylaminohydrolase